MRYSRRLRVHCRLWDSSNKRNCCFRGAVKVWTRAMRLRRSALMWSTPEFFTNDEIGTPNPQPKAGLPSFVPYIGCDHLNLNNACSFNQRYTDEQEFQTICKRRALMEMVEKNVSSSERQQRIESPLMVRVLWG